ncbi:MAG: MBL fold metallo-hydrolase [Fidelibacterota bacterium]|nr:MAG: MBL fold metallo-hydrolase [Candidatus Neomarinimicrobiota bacterium]
MKKSLLFFASIVLVLQDCALINVTRSDKRAHVPQSIKLSTDVILTPSGAVNILNTDFFPASFRIEAQGKVIYIDPLVIEDVKPADYIFITHSNSDHLSTSDIEKITKKETLIVCPKKAVKRLSGYTVKEVKPGDVLDLGDIQCEAVAAYNTKTAFLWLTAHPKSHMNVGYILTINDVRIYHAGDTDFIPEMNSIKDITVALVPIDGGSLTMETEQAADAINAIRPLIAVPMHYEIGTDQVEIFKQLVDEDIVVKIIEKGE